MRFIFLAISFFCIQFYYGQNNVDASIGSKFTKADVSEFLAHHNMARSAVGREPLKWDAKLAAYAQEWANHLADSLDCALWHRSQLNRKVFPFYGENLFMSWPAREVAAASVAWYDEKRNLKPDGTVTGVVGHYRQIIAENTNYVGAAVAYCKRGAMVVVANYR